MGTAARAARVFGKLILGAQTLLLLGLLGCASQPPRGFAPDRVRLEVPFYRDAGARGATSTLAEVLTFWDEPTEPKDLAGELHIENALHAPERTLPDALLLAAQDRGMQARSFQATPADVRDELKGGHPVVAYLNLAPERLGEARFVVITGFDDGRGGFFVNGRGANKFVRYDAFMARWEKTGRWAILVLPAGEPAMSDRSARSSL